MRQSDESYLEGRQLRRMKVENRYLVKLEKQVKQAEKMVGELIRNGKPIYYIFPVGGRYRESNDYFDLVNFLVRNHYV